MVDMSLRGVQKKYPNAENYSVVDFNLDIEDKEFIVFVGPSGCGKSTTLRMIAGLEDITDGDLIINDTVMNDVAPKDRGIAMVFQNYALYPHMTVYDNMAFGLQLRKYDKNEIDKKVKHAAKILGLADLLDRKPAALSGGQSQRVALGRAIVRDADVFLMDEPLSNLDAKLRVQMRAEISRLHQDLGSTTIYVTHDQTEAMTMADRIVIMNAGYVQQIGSPIEVYDNPANQFVASFMGSPAMNFFDVTYSNGEIRHGEKFKLPVTAPDRKILDAGGYEGKKLVFGIRPEDIQSEMVILEALPEQVIEATVNVAEMLGSETLLYLQIGDAEIIAKVDSRDYNEPGTKINVAFNMNKAHFFDADNGVALKYR